MTLHSLLAMVIETTTLPEDISWYEVDGEKLFPIRDKVSGYVAYLIRKPKTKFEQWFKYGINFERVSGYTEDSSKITWARLEIDRAIKDFEEYLDAYPDMPENRKYVIDPDGGDLGTGDNVKEST